MWTKHLLTIQQQAIGITTEVAKFIQSEYGKINEQNVEIKSLNSLVTYVDTKAELLLVEQLQKLIPTATFLTEEKTITPQDSQWQWIIDPLDGTTNFIHQIPVFAISVALKYDNEIVLGIVYEINRKECFYASKNNGAFLNGKLISVSETSILKDALIATGFPYYNFKRAEKYLDFLKYLMQNTRGIRRLGSAATDLCYTACGRFDAFFEYSLSPWDVAAGALIVKEAGGVIADFSAKENWLFGEEIIAVNPKLATQFSELIQKYFIL